MEGRQLLQYIIDTSDVVLAKKIEATEYLAKLEAAQQSRAVDLPLPSASCPKCHNFGGTHFSLCPLANSASQ